jgi:D-lactate dehydrogenase
MRRIAFFEVAPYEREAIAAFSPPDVDVLRFVEPLNPETAQKATDAEAVSVFVYSTLDERVLERLPSLRFVTTRSTGYDHIDLNACAQRGVRAAFVPSYGENTVAEHAFALVFALSKRLPRAMAQTRTLDFSLNGLEGVDLKGKGLGIIGMGRIGAHTARIGRGAGMRVLAYDPREDLELAAKEGFRYVPLDDLLSSSDVISIHAALVPQTFHLLDRAAFRKMKPGAILVNTARGGIVDSEALCEALDRGWVAAAGLDVFEGEELIKDEARVLQQPLNQQQLRHLALCHSLLLRDNVILTPHMAFFTREGVDRLLETTFDNLKSYLAGAPRNPVPGLGS